MNSFTKNLSALLLHLVGVTRTLCTLAVTPQFSGCGGNWISGSLESTFRPLLLFFFLLHRGATIHCPTTPLHLCSKHRLHGLHGPSSPKTSHDGSATGHLSFCPPIRHGVYFLSHSSGPLALNWLSSRLSMAAAVSSSSTVVIAAAVWAAEQWELLSRTPPPKRGSSPFIAARSGRTKRLNFKFRPSRVLGKHRMDFIVRFYDFAYKLPGR